MDEEDDGIEWGSCEHCRAKVDAETLRCMGEVNFCPTCADAWLAEFDACLHEWRAEPMTDEWGDEGRYCERCCGFVTHETARERWPHLYGPLAHEAQMAMDAG